MQDLLILCYHAVSPTWPAALSVTPEALDRQLQILARRGYRSARFTDVVTAGLDGRVVAITFDDNYRSVLELAKPIFDRHGYAGTLFVPTDSTGPPQPLLYPRAAIFHDDDIRRFRVKVAPAMRRARASRLGRTLDRVRVAREERT